MDGQTEEAYLALGLSNKPWHPLFGSCMCWTKLEDHTGGPFRAAAIHFRRTPLSEIADGVSGGPIIECLAIACQASGIETRRRRKFEVSLDSGGYQSTGVPRVPFWIPSGDRFGGTHP